MKRDLRTYWLTTNVSVRTLGAVDRSGVQTLIGVARCVSAGGVQLAVSRGRDFRWNLARRPLRAEFRGSWRSLRGRTQGVEPAYAGRRDCANNGRRRRSNLKALWTLIGSCTRVGARNDLPWRSRAVLQNLPPP